MIILGIGLQHDAGAALISNGCILAAVNEERFNRKKMYWGFPKRSIYEVLRLSSIAPKDLDVVAVANTTQSDYASNWEGIYPKDFKRKMIIWLSKLGIARWIGGNCLGVEAYRILNSKSIHLFKNRKFRNIIRDFGISAPIVYVDHHKAHLASAYYTSGWNNCLSLSLDGVGDGYCSRIAICQNNKMHTIHQIPFYHTPGQYYGFVTAWAGFTPGIHEGKITGLAAYGDPEKALHIFRGRIGYSEKKFSFINRGKWGWAEYESLCQQLNGYQKSDVAAAIQHHLEDLVSRYVKQAIEKTGLRKIALSGGIFANVKLNQRIRDLEEVEDIYVHPNMGDGGLGTGSALLLNVQSSPIQSQPLKNVYLGTGVPEEEIVRELKRLNFPFVRQDNVEKAIAEYLAEGKVLARINGQMEYGPRALGNRTILYQATDITVNHWLNKRLRRTEFMPFAPAILQERAKHYYREYPASRYSAEFMTITYNVTERCKKEAPAIVHVDNTARPQFVSKKTNPSFYKILKEYEKLTGYPQVINTSFNMHEEPIACTVFDAIRAFQKSQLDIMAIGPYIVEHPQKTYHTSILNERIEHI